MGRGSKEEERLQQRRPLSEQVLALGPAGGKEAEQLGVGGGGRQGGTVDPQSKHRLEGNIPAGTLDTRGAQNG